MIDLNALEISKNSLSAIVFHYPDVPIQPPTLNAIIQDKSIIFYSPKELDLTSLHEAYEYAKLFSRDPTLELKYQLFYKEGLDFNWIELKWKIPNISVS